MFLDKKDKDKIKKYFRNNVPFRSNEPDTTALFYVQKVIIIKRKKFQFLVKLH